MSFLVNEVLITEIVVGSAKKWIEEQLENRSEQQGFNHPIDRISSITCEYLLPSLASIFSVRYNCTISPSTCSLDRTNVFLLGECHSQESTWRKLNGRFVSYLATFYSVIIFVEGFPSMKILNHNEAQHCKTTYQINNSDSSIQFYGWDFSGPLKEETADEVAKWRALEHEYKQLKQKRDSSKNSQEKRILSQKIDTLIAHWKKINASVDARILNAFPIRTQAMVSALQSIRKEKILASRSQTKFVFFAGEYHLRERDSQTKEYSLALLHEELRHHEAAIMIPTIDDPQQKR